MYRTPICTVLYYISSARRDSFQKISHFLILSFSSGSLNPKSTVCCNTTRLPLLTNCIASLYAGIHCSSLSGCGGTVDLLPSVALFVVHCNSFVGRSSTAGFLPILLLQPDQHCYCSINKLIRQVLSIFSRRPVVVFSMHLSD